MGDVEFDPEQKTIVVIAVAPTGKASFVYSYVQTRLMGQYNENDQEINLLK